MVCGEPARSVEHVIPRWLTRYVGEGGVIVEQMDCVAEDGTSARLHARETTTAGRKTVKVCARCNNGWMATLEDWSKPYLKRLADGEPGAMRGSVATVLLAWALKTSIVAMAASQAPLQLDIARPLMQGLRDLRAPKNAFLRVGLSPFDGPLVMPASLQPVCTKGDRDVGLQGLIVVGAAILRVGWIAPGVNAVASTMIREADGLVQVYPETGILIPWSAGRWALGDPVIPDLSW